MLLCKLAQLNACIPHRESYISSQFSKAMSSYLITGCSRGLGLELVKQLSQKPASSVSAIIATARSPTPPAALAEHMKASQGRAHYVPLDVVSTDSIKSAVQQTSQILGSGGLDVLLNNAVMQTVEMGEESDMRALSRMLEANVVAVNNVTQAFLPLLRRGKGKKVVNLTSTLGSMGLNEIFKAMPVPSYKVCKAAVNMLTVQTSNLLESEGFTVFCVSPGWLKTDLGTEQADLTVDVGAKALLDIVFNSTTEDSGKLRNISVEGDPRYDGKNPPW